MQGIVMLPPVVTDADRTVVARQLGREPRTLRRVAVRCPFGAPAVTEQSPYGPDGEPFPTTYYLTCRHLVAALFLFVLLSAAALALFGQRGSPRHRAYADRAAEVGGELVDVVSNIWVVKAFSALRRCLALIMSGELKTIDLGYNQMLIIYHLSKGELCSCRKAHDERGARRGYLPHR